jgi:hypothetical protein
LSGARRTCPIAAAAAAAKRPISASSPTVVTENPNVLCRFMPGQPFT